MARQRNTRQREVLWEALKESGRPVSVQELHELGAQQLDGLGIATVYRAVNSFLEEKLIEEVEIPGHAVRYELTGLPHHHHFHCTACDKVFDMKDCVGGVSRLAPDGFEVEENYILLSGKCPECTGTA